MKLEITNAQLEAIKKMTDILSAMVGSADEESTFDKDIKHYTKLIDKMLKNNKLQNRCFK